MIMACVYAFLDKRKVEALLSEEDLRFTNTNLHTGAKQNYTDQARQLKKKANN